MNVQEDLIDTLKQCGVVVNAATNNMLNRGGCCVFAAHVARKLNAIGINAKVIVAGYEGHEARSLSSIRPKLNTNTVHDWRKNGVEFCHVGVLFRYNGKYYTYDSERIKVGRKPIGRWHVPPYKGHLLLEEADQLAKSTNWNFEFDRRQIPTVHKIIDQHFKKLEQTS